jgi:hypothetical protein
MTLSRESPIATPGAHAAAKDTTPSEQFRPWLDASAQRANRADAAMAVVSDIRKYADVGGRKFTRDGMNER